MDLIYLFMACALWALVVALALGCERLQTRRVKS
jgi:hypothetical protein